MRAELDTIEHSEIIKRDPATGEEIGRVPLLGSVEVLDAVKRARAAQPSWARLSYRQRGQVISRAREIVLRDLEPIAQLISQETGKPKAEAISMEVVPTLDLMHYFAVNTAKILKPNRIDLGQYDLV